MPTEIKVLPATKELKVEETVQLAVRVTPENAEDGVTYSSSNEEIATVSATGVVKAKAKGTATITATSTADTKVKGTCEITVTEDEVINPTVDWSKVNVSTPLEFYNAENNAAVKVEGKCTIVTAPNKKGLIGAYLQNGKAGYYVFGMEEANKIEVGKSYTIGGYKTKTYNGIIELQNIELIEESTKTFTVETSEITPEIADDFEKAKDYLYGYVKLGVCTPLELSVNETKAYNIQSTVGGKEIYLRVDPSISGEAETAKINAKLKNFIIGGTMTVNKALVTSSGYGKLDSSYVITSADDFEVTPLKDEELVEIASRNIAMPNFLKKGDNANEKLPKTIEGMDGVAVTYEFDGTLIGKDGVVIGAEMPTLGTIKATFTKGEAKYSAQYSIAVDGTKELTSSHTLDLEDALPAKDYGCSASKPGYAEGAIKLGNPAATWNLRNSLIASTKDDRKNGTWSIRAQVNSDPAASARIELKEDYDFSVLEFTFGTYGTNPLGTTLSVSYSVDGGVNWTEDFITFKSTQYELETVKVSIPGAGAKTRVAINLKPGLGKRVNIDDIKLLK